MIWQNGNEEELEIGPSAAPGEVARIVTRHRGNGFPFYATPDTFAGIAVALWKSAGQPAPVITPRPDVDTSAAMPFHSLTVAVLPGAVRLIHSPGGRVIDDLPPAEARRLAGLLVAYADAAESEPDPGDVEQLAALVGAAFEEARAPGIVDAGWFAAFLLRSGKVTLSGEGGDRGE